MALHDDLLQALHAPDPGILRALHEARARGSEEQALQAEVSLLRKQVAALQRTLAVLASAVAQGDASGAELGARLLAATQAPGAPEAGGPAA